MGSRVVVAFVEQEAFLVALVARAAHRPQCYAAVVGRPDGILVITAHCRHDPQARVLLRLLALVSYIFHAFSRYLTRERIILGREGLDELLYKDALTGCLNRRHFDSFSADDEALGEGFFIVVYDLDGIKHVNDSFGHSEGDRVFSHFGQAVGQTFGERSFTCRTGGDEFVSIVYGLDEEAFTGVLESFAATFPTECPYSATFSSGWSRYDGGGRDDFEEALRKADKMMYSQKEEHRRQMARTLGRLE